MKITNTTVTGLYESIVASSLPMETMFDPIDFDTKTSCMKSYVKYMDRPETLCGIMSDSMIEWCEKRWKRVTSLGRCDGGESHDCYLCGINVQFNITAPRLFFPEEQRYHFADIVSSTSTMHCIKRNVKAMAEDQESARKFFCDYTDPIVISIFIQTAFDLISQLPENEDEWDSGTDKTLARIKSIIPEGMLQTARITTNYRQLKTWVRQRSMHRLQEWRDVCKWIHTLPLFDELTTRKNRENEDN